MDRVTVVGVAGGGALDVPRAPALLLHPGRAVCVHLPADRHGGAHGQVRVRILQWGKLLKSGLRDRTLLVKVLVCMCGIVSIFLASSPQMILRLEQQFFNVGEFVKRDALLLQ